MGISILMARGMARRLWASDMRAATPDVTASRRTPSRSSGGRPRRSGGSASPPLAPIAATDSPKIRGPSHLGLGHGQRRRHPDGTCRTQHEQASREGGPWTSSACSAVSKLDAEHQAGAADVADERREAIRRGARPAIAWAPRAAAFSTSRPRRSIVARPPRRRPGCRRRSNRGLRRPMPRAGRPGDHRPERHPARDPLGAEEDVRLDPTLLDRHIVPVRPAPDGYSSAMSRIPCWSRDRPEAFEESVLRDEVPPSPWIGSTMIAATSLAGQLVEQDLVEPAQVGTLPTARGTRPAGAARSRRDTSPSTRSGSRRRTSGRGTRRGRRRRTAAWSHSARA